MRFKMFWGTCEIRPLKLAKYLPSPILLCCVFFFCTDVLVFPLFDSLSKLKHHNFISVPCQSGLLNLQRQLNQSDTIVMLIVVVSVDGPQITLENEYLLYQFMAPNLY